MYKPLELNQVYKANCLIALKRIKDKSIDLVLCDLPYGTTANDWDKPIDLDILWSHYNRIIKDSGAIILFAQSPFDKILSMSNIDMFRYEWIWEKELGTGFLNAKKMPLKVHENILVFYKKLPTYNPIKTKGHKKIVKKASADKCISSSNYGKTYRRSDYNSDERYPRSVLKFTSDRARSKNSKGTKHPTQKPVKLFEYLIKTYTNEKDIVLDNCIGSGTTAIAAIRTNRKFIGFDNKKQYVLMSRIRIKESKGEIGLFRKELMS